MENTLIQILQVLRDIGILIGILTFIQLMKLVTDIYFKY